MLILLFLSFVLLLSGCAMPNNRSYIEEYREKQKHKFDFAKPAVIEIFKKELPPRLKKLWAGRALKNFNFGEPMSVQSIEYNDLIVKKVEPYAATVPVTFSQKEKSETFEVSVSFDESNKMRVEDYISGPVYIFFKTDPLAKYRKNKKVLSAIKEKKIYLGMPEDALFLSWGRPRTTNSSVGHWGKRNQHVYGMGSYVYTVNGKISSWQN